MIGVGHRLVLTPAQDAREAHRDAGFVPRATVHRFNPQLEHMMRRDRAHRAEALGSIGPDPTIQLQNFAVVQTRIRLGDRHQLAFVPQPEGVIGIERAASAVAGLRIQQHGIDGERVDLPFPPIAAPATGLIHRTGALEHQSFHPALARFHTYLRCGVPIADLHQRRGDDARICQRGEDAFQQSAPLLQRAPAQVCAIQFQQVVGHHTRGRGGQGLGPGLEPLDARLQCSKWHRQGLLRLPGQQLAIDHGAVG